MARIQEDFNLTPVLAKAHYEQMARYFSEHGQLPTKRGELCYLAVAAEEPAGKPIASCRKVQIRLELTASEGPPSSYDVADFIRWAAARRFVGTLEVLRPATRTGSALDEEQRWRIVGRLLHDGALELTDRVAGCLVLLFAQQLSRIVAIGVNQVVATGGEVHLRLGAEDLLIPDPLGALLSELVTRARRYVGVGTPAGSPWLFPGLHPGRPLTAARLGDRLAKLGIDGRAGRRAALMHLAAQLPAAALAEMLGLTPETAVRWVRAAGGDRASYAAEVARGVIARDAECSSR